MSKAPLKTTIVHEGQAYVHEAVHVEVSRAKPLALAINSMGGSGRPLQEDAPPATINITCGDGNIVTLFVEKYVGKDVSARPVVLPSIDTFSHHDLVQLRWMKPDGKGGLVPK